MMVCFASFIFTLIFNTVVIYGSNCPDRQAIEKSLQKVHIPGAAIVVVNATHVLYEQAFGYQSLSPEQPIDVDRSIFGLASISKIFIATAVMQLVEQERIDLDTDINQYLSEPNRRIFHPQYPLHSITLRKLLSHSASIAVPDQVLYTYFLPGDSAFVESLAEMCFKYVNPNTSYWLPKPPGSVTFYSNEGPALAALVIERVTQMPYIDYVKVNILKPLGVDINKVGVRLADFANNTDDLVKHYTYALNSSYLPIWNQEIPGLNLTQMPGDLPTWLFIHHFSISVYPAGLLRMSARTLSIYLRMFLSNGSIILSPRSIAEMRTVVGGGLIPYYQDSNSSSTRSSPPILFGISWYWETMSNGRRYLGHSGSLPGMLHLMLTDETNSVGVILLSNGDTGEPVNSLTEIRDTLAEIHMSLFQCFEINAINVSATTSVTSSHASSTPTTAGSSCQKVRSSVFFVVVVLRFLF